MVRVLEERGYAEADIRLYASPRSAGGRIRIGNHDLAIAPLNERTFIDLDLALFALEDDLAKEWVPRARERGIRVVDNSSAFRLDPEVPLVVPEVNGALLDARPPVVANPNCSTIQLVVALAPLARMAGLRRVVAVTFQSASGAGQPALDELREGTRRFLAGEAEVPEVFPKPIAFNCIPKIGAFDDDGRSREEQKMLAETRRILDLPDLAASFTCVRVPTLISHAVAVHVETLRAVEPAALLEAWSRSPGVVVGDGRDAAGIPTPRDAAGRDEVFVGRLRRETGVEHGLAFWVVADNLRKGAATNAVQIADVLLER
jgi:aspartate-semialdehyde dehydrogenase